MERKKAISPPEIVKRVQALTDTPRPFLATLAGGAPAVIGEVRRKSPGGPELRPDYDPAALAKAYASLGARALAVATDHRILGGERAHLKVAKEASGLPVLQKDFLIDVYQIYEARLNGADAILLDSSVLSHSDVAQFLNVGKRLGMDVVLSVNSPMEADRALELGAAAVHLNALDLKTLALDLARVETLAPLVQKPEGPRPLIIEDGGLTSQADVARVVAAGVNVVFAGDAVLAESDLAAGWAKLFG